MWEQRYLTKYLKAIMEDYQHRENITKLLLWDSIKSEKTK